MKLLFTHFRKDFLRFSKKYYNRSIYSSKRVEHRTEALLGVVALLQRSSVVEATSSELYAFYDTKFYRRLVLKLLTWMLSSVHRYLYFITICNDYALQFKKRLKVVKLDYIGISKTVKIILRYKNIREMAKSVAS